MLRILFKQPVNIWRTLEMRHKIEAIILWVLMYAFFASRLHTLFLQWQTKSATASGIVLIIVNLFTMQISISSTFIIAWLIPKQKNLHHFLSIPLDSKQLYKLVGYYSCKYLSLYLLLFIPTATAIASSIGWTWALLAVLFTGIIGLFFVLLNIWLKARIRSISNFVAAGIFVSLLLHVSFTYFYWMTDSALVFQIIVTLTTAILGLILFRSKTTQLNLESFVEYLPKIYRSDLHTNSTRLRRRVFLPHIVQVLYDKEMAALWRNKKYRKLKIYTFLSFLIIAIAVSFSALPDKEIWLTIVTALTIWLHYSNSFNEKYIFPDPDWFIRTLPIKFRHLLTAKYFTEIPFVILLIILETLLLFALGIDQALFLTLVFILFGFANLVLFAMLNFQIMFYNDPRLAGYAYNFTLLFLVIMILNYRLVGPIIALGLMGFFLYKNVKYFKS